MENKTNLFKRFHTSIRTQHVFIEDEQVYLKKEFKESGDSDSNFAEWFPTDFQWIPITS